ncbi:MAG: nucleotide sugar dehydrogenase [Alphaproteobacteria bacterium]|nr:nucleotide sugar dehydrogenase [Alphaproteobacteria bacterium]
MKSVSRIAVLGLGYVGLPLAVALARHFRVTGYDIDIKRISELREGQDRTREVAAEALGSPGLELTERLEALKGADLFIVAVPTPVDDAKRPDLAALKAAAEAVGSVLGPGAVVVFESTVYPGVTEEVCGPLLEKASGLRAGVDFFLGYSPERMNPGDQQHTLERITKVVAGQTPEVAALLKDVYGRLNDGNIFVALDIRTAEAAKVIENTQRDINIAFINEVTEIFGTLGLSTHDVLDAAATKWNFLDFRPGLVGGHCIGVDPFYLAHCSQAQGHDPEIILAGRRINDRMGGRLAERIDAALKTAFADEKSARVLVLGLTFKENLPDLRNTKVIDLIRGLEARGHRVDTHDAFADPEEAKRLYGVKLMPALEGIEPYHCVVGAVPHAPYGAFTGETFLSLLVPDGLIADIKGMWLKTTLPEGVRRWQL